MSNFWEKDAPAKTQFWERDVASLPPNAGPDSALPPDAAVAKPQTAAPAPEPSFGQPGWKPPGSDLQDRLTRSMTFGISDFVGAAGDVLGDKISRALGYDAKEPLTYGEALGAIRMANRKFSTEHPVQAIAADTVGMLASPLTKGLSAASQKGAELVSKIPGLASVGEAGTAAVRQSLPNMAVRGGIEGTTMGAALSDALTPEGVVKDAGTGGITGTFMSPFMGLIGRWINPQVNPNAKYLMDRGVTPKPGQIAGGGWKTVEEKAGSLPIINEAQRAAQKAAFNEFNVAGYEEALGPLGPAAINQAPNVAGPKGLEDTGKIISNVYETVLPQMNFSAAGDTTFTTELANLKALTRNLPSAMRKTFDAELNQTLMHHLGDSGTMDGKTLQIAYTDLRDLAQQYGSGANQNVSQRRLLGSAFKEAKRIFGTALERQNPDLAPQFQKANEAWANFAILRDAAKRVGAKNKIFSPAHLASAVQRADKSAGKMNTIMSRGPLAKLANAGTDVLGTEYPDSGTPGRLLADAALTGAAGFWRPEVLVGLGAGSLPYLPGGRQAAAALVGKRPQVAAPIARAISRAGMPLTIAGTSSLLAND